jgi:hypothetical protein
MFNSTGSLNMALGFIKNLKFKNGLLKIESKYYLEIPLFNKIAIFYSTIECDSFLNRQPTLNKYI